MDKCWECRFKGEVPGSAHICCKFDWDNAKTNMPKCESSHGRRWFYFPWNFDPCWGDECKQFIKDE